MNTSFTFIAIGSAIFAAIANILARILLKSIRAKEILGINFFIMTLTLAAASPLFYLFEVSTTTVALLIAIGFVDTVANYFYFKTFEKTEASIATPLLSLAPVFTFFAGWLFIDDVVSFQTYLLALTITALVIVFSTSRDNFKQFRADTLLPALLSSVLFGLSAIPSKYLLDNLDATNAPTLYMFRAALIALFSLIIFRQKVPKITLKQYRFIFIRGLFVITQWLLLYYALSMGSAGVSITLGNITPIFVFIFSVLWLNEKPTAKKAVTATLILLLSLMI